VRSSTRGDGKDWIIEVEKKKIYKIKIMIVITIKNQGINRSFLIYFFIKNKLNLMNGFSGFFNLFLIGQSFLLLLPPPL